MIKILASGKDSAEILIHEAIGENWFGDGLTSKKFAQELSNLGDVSSIKLRINSPGGAVSDGIAIYNILKAHGARIDVMVEGIAASIASIIAMAGTKITMGEGAQMMIHSPWTIAMGDAEEMRKAADTLDQFEGALLDIYVSRTGKPRNVIKSMLNDETWFNGKSAVAEGFADEAMDGADTEAAALIETEHRASFAKFAKEFRQPADRTPSRIAAVLKSALSDAKVKEVKKMDPIPASVIQPDPNALKEAAQNALQADLTRRREIEALFKPFGDEHRDLQDTCTSDVNMTPALASEKLLKKLGEKAEPLGGRITITQDARDNFRAGAGNALMARLGKEKIESGNEFAGRSLVDIAEKALNLAGISTRGLTKDGIARKVLATMTTSDFPQLLSVTAGKVLRAAYDVYPQTWKSWALPGSVSDFKIHPRIQIGSFDSLATISEGGEYTYGSLNEAYENAQAATKGKGIIFSRQMLINDDLGGFNRRASLMGAAAARSVNNDAYAYLTSGSSNNGPTSTDTGQFFNTTAVTTAGGHANLKGSSGAAPTVVTLGAARVAMQKQKDPGLKETLNIQPAVLLVPVALEDTARTLIASETDPASSNANVPNIYRNRFAVVADPYLDSISATAWYLLADPNGPAAAIEMVFLDGVQTPYVDETISFDTDGMKFKVRLDYGTANGDWRGGYRNVGA